jgi:hypothetical protein
MVLPYNIMADKCKIYYMLFCIVFLNFWKKSIICAEDIILKWKIFLGISSPSLVEISQSLSFNIFTI